MERQHEEQDRKKEAQKPIADAKGNFSKDTRFKAKEQDEREMLYPDINFARPTYHAAKSVMKSETKRKVEEESVTASTAATSVQDKKEKEARDPWGKGGVSIAPVSVIGPGDPKYERMLW